MKKILFALSLMLSFAGTAYGYTYYGPRVSTIRDNQITRYDGLVSAEALRPVYTQTSYNGCGCSW